MSEQRTTGVERLFESVVLVLAIGVLAFAVLELHIAQHSVQASPVIATEANTASDRIDSAPWTVTVTSPTIEARRLFTVDQTPSKAPTKTVGIDLGRQHQTWLGIGGALTDVAVELIDSNPEAFALLFDQNRTDGASLNLLRLPLSATDFSSTPWTWGWDDRRSVATPTAEAHRAVRLIDDIVDLRPDASIVAAPWTAPAEMVGQDGALLPGSVDAFGNLLTEQVGWLLDRGVPLTAVSMLNEPGYATEYPSMTMTDTQMIDIARATAAELDDRDVELWAVDHNWADRDRVDAVLDGAPEAFDAAAFHCYDGEPGEMASSSVPSVVTECTGTTDNWISTFGWDSRVLVEGSLRSGATGLMMWNLALAPDTVPLGDGCADCRGVLTVDPTTGDVTQSPEFFVLAHLAHAADPGAIRVDTNLIDGLPTVAFVNPDGSVGIFGHNDTDQTQVIDIVRSDGVATTITVGPWELFSARR